MMLDAIVILFIVVKKCDRFPDVFIMNMECYCYGYILKDMGSIWPSNFNKQLPYVFLNFFGKLLNTFFVLTIC